MTDPLTLTTISNTVLTEGVKFLYGQASEVLKRWRDRRHADGNAEEAPASPMVVRAPGVLDGELAPIVIDFGAVNRLAPELRSLRSELEGYVEDGVPVEPGDVTLLGVADALRRVLETVYGQRITFQGEQRTESGPTIGGSVDVEEIAGYAAAVRARRLISGQITGHATARRVGRGGELVVLDFGTVGEPERGGSYD